MPAVQLIAFGDLMLGDSAVCVGFGMHSTYRGPHLERAFEPVLPLLRTADLAIGNLECVLTSAGHGRTRLARDQMRGDPEYAEVLRRCGFRALGVANNHAIQHGEEGFAETVRHLEAAGVACFGLRGQDGWCSRPVIIDLGGNRVGILGYCWRPRQYGKGEPPFAEGTPQAVLADLVRLRPQVDHLVLSLHWGEEFVPRPSAGEVSFAREAVTAGADVIIGHHPHVLRPVERCGRAVIAYSLGNGVGDMVWQEALRVGGILRCTLSSGVTAASLCPIRLDRSYRPQPTGPCENVGTAPIEGLPEEDYRRSIEASVRSQRRAVYRYAASNLRRFPPRIALELAASTAANKLSGLFSGPRG